MHWFNVTVSTTKDELPKLEEWLWDHGAVSVTVEDGHDNPIYEPPPGAQPLWDEILVTGLFESDVLIEELTVKLSGESFDVRDVEKVEDKPWEREWLSQFKPMQFGSRLWVCPTGFDLPEDEGRAIIHLDPGLAFGTGTHETTRLCLEYLDGLDLIGKVVIDYGCGSGILSLGAGVLGASQLIGVDNDPQALVATQANADRNSIAIQTQFPGNSLPQADVVMANILAQPLVELADLLLSVMKPDGLLILSGIMASQGDWVASAYHDSAKQIDRTELNGWLRLVWRH
jgi:ribosomal protein L11 methyltransferase